MRRVAHAAALAAALAGGAGLTQATSAGAAPAVAEARSPMAGFVTVVLDETSVGEARVRVGDRVEVRLKAQFGTGFSWAAAGPAPAPLKPAGEAVEPAEAPQPPEGGYETQVFSFEAVTPGEARLDFVYRRPWLPDDPANRHATFAVTVTAQ